MKSIQRTNTPSLRLQVKTTVRGDYRPGGIFKGDQMNKAKEVRITKIRNRMMTALQDELKSGDITALELLAVMAYTTGACVAMQDKAEVSIELAHQIITHNIESGNLQCIKELNNYINEMH